VGVGDPRKLAKAQREFDRALGETNPRKAIERFKKAWESSQKVVEDNELVIKSFDDSPDPFSPSLASNTLSATFLIHQKGRFRKDDDGNEKHGRGDKDDDRGKKRDRDDDDDDRDKRRDRRDDDRRSRHDRDDKDDDRGKRHRRGDKADDEKEQRPFHLEYVEIIRDSSNATVRTLTTQHTIPHAPRKHRNRFVEVTVTSVWDGKDDQGEIVPDGAYKYLAFGKVVSVDDQKGRHRKHRGDDDDDEEDDKKDGNDKERAKPTAALQSIPLPLPNSWSKWG